ncbi:MAG: ABC transporter permease [Desulfobacterales bacterium]|jgi:ABC-2 type transport system permease protein|nr:ABC transporter permease [Desulfobacterales bacterium]
MNWPRVRELVRKEFIQLFRDRKNRPLLVIAPLVQMVLFGYVVTTDVRDVTVAVVDQARTPESRRLVEAFDASPTFRVTHTLPDPRQLDRLLLRRAVDIGLQIPPDFSARIRKGETAEIQILVDGSMSNMAGVRIAYSMSVLDSFNSELLREIHRRHIDFGEIDGRVRTWYNPNLDSQYFYVPGIVAFLVMLLSLLFTSMAVVREKEAGTMEQLIVTPLTASEFILGKTIPFILIAQAQMGMVILFARLWFQIPMAGNALLLLAASLIFLSSTLGIGLLISSVSRTQQQAMMTNFFFILPFFMLSGFVFPIANMPAPVQWLTHLNPLSHFLVIIRGVFLKGTGVAVLWPQFAELAALGGIVFAAAIGRFRKRLD